MRSIVWCEVCGLPSDMTLMFIGRFNNRKEIIINFKFSLKMTIIIFKTVIIIMLKHNIFTKKPKLMPLLNTIKHKQ